ncbi:hypothetical protein ACFWMR_01430 [Amycolatopsis thailandensis]|uniref:hypothetical protein n=1 Tax=Amycolatopsis thailandensis TaxID=589330 RepID=UPI003662684F
MTNPTRRPRGGREANEIGASWEYRLARLRFVQGFFVRRAIDVWPDGLQGNQLAELDVLATSFDPRTRRRTELIEAKSGSGAKEVDRVMWMRGMAAYTSVDEVTFAKVRVDARVRQVAKRVRVNILDEAAVIAAEKAVGIDPDDWVGYADPQLGETVVKEARAHLNSSDPLRRAGKFLFGTFWSTDEFARIQQLRTLAGLLNEHRDQVEPTAFAFACNEVVTLTALSTLEVTNWRGQYEPAEFQKFATEQLTGGFGRPDGLRRVLAQVDAMNHQFIEDLHDEYTATGVARISRRIPQLQQELLRVPEWVEAFMDLSARMQEHAGISMHVLRLLDLRAAGRLGSTRDTSKITKAWAGDSQRVEDIANLIEKFCVSAWGLPEHGLERVNAGKASPVDTQRHAMPSAIPPAGQAVQPTLDQDT